MKITLVLLALALGVIQAKERHRFVYDSNVVTDHTSCFANSDMLNQFLNLRGSAGLEFLQAMRDGGQVIEVEKFTPIRVIGTGWSETGAQRQRNYVSGQIVAKQIPTAKAREIVQIILPSHQPFGFHDRRDICWISSTYFGKAYIDSQTKQRYARSGNNKIRSGKDLKDAELIPAQ